MTTPAQTFSIGDVSARTGLSVDTLRFYERQGLFPPVDRTVGGRRVFSDDDIAWIGICQRLRASGMPLPEVARYATLVAAGSGNESQRLELLQRHEAEVRSQMAVLQEALDLITVKVHTYTDALAQGTAGGLFERDRDDDAYFAAMDADRSTSAHPRQGLQTQ
jgi:DNA-binding transcriptional MerR regulator